MPLSARLWLGMFLAPFLYGLYWKKVTRPAVWASFGFGVGIMLTQLVLSMLKLIPESGFIHFVFQNSLYTGVIAMICGLVIVPIVSLCTQKKKPDNVDAIFDCYNVEVKVKAARSLEDDK